MKQELRDLLADVDWLRSLARRLSKDDDLADDLVQDTCSVVLRQSASPEHGRSWLIGIMRRLLLAHRRRVAQQKQHLALVKTDEHSEATETVVQRAEVHQMLVQAVLQLEEPYRSTVLLRFFESLPPREIAERQGLPVATVHSRLQRGLSQLRERLDRDAGSRARWLALAAPFAWPDDVVRGVRRASSVRWSGAAAAVLACGGLAVWATVGGSQPPVGPIVARMAIDAPRLPPAANEPADRVDANEAPASVATNEVGLTEVRGRVCDCNGNGLAGLAVSAVLGDAPPATRTRAMVRAHFAVTGAGGVFTGRLDGTAAYLLVADDGYENVLLGDWRSDAAVEPVIVVAPSMRVGGRVVEADGRPVNAGHVRFELPADLLSRLRLRVDRSSTSSWSTPVAVDGGFAFAVPRIAGATLRFTATACAAAIELLPVASTTAMHVVLPALAPSGSAVQGRVLTDDGAPAFGAIVTMGRTSSATDRDGRFSLAIARAGMPTAIVAAMPGVLPARHEPPANGGAFAQDWPRDLVLRLGLPAGEVTGQVVDDAGPVAAVEVWIDDPTPFGGPVVDARAMQVEYVIGGAPLRSPSWDAATLASTSAASPDAGASQGGRGSWVHEDHPTAAWQFVTTGRDGRFTVPGLLPRAYRLRAFDRHTGRFGEVADVTAASAPTIVLPGRSAAVILRGRVVAANGDPLAGVVVQQKFELFERAASVSAAAESVDRFKVLRDGPSVRSGDDGSFVLRDTHLRGAFLMLDGEQVMPTRFGRIELLVGDEEGAAALLRVDRRCPLEVVLADPGGADQVLFLDASRNPMLVGVQLTMNTKNQTTMVSLHEGRSGPLVVGERAASCIFVRAGKVVREVPIAPGPGLSTLVQ